MILLLYKAFNIVISVVVYYCVILMNLPYVPLVSPHHIFTALTLPNAHNFSSVARAPRTLMCIVCSTWRWKELRFNYND